MEIRLVTKEKNLIEVEFPDKDENYLILLQEQLLKNKKVKEAYYNLTHSVLSTPTLTIIMKNGRAETALKNAALTLIKEFEDAEGAFKAATGA